MQILIRLLNVTRLSALLRRFVWRRKVRIGVYHQIEPRRFEEHLRVLSRNYRLISLDALVTALETNDWGQIPDNAFVITFDDGAEDFYHLREILRCYAAPVTHYMVSSIVGTRRHFWFREVKDEDKVESLKLQPNVVRMALLSDRFGYRAEREYEEPQALSLAQLRELMELGVTVGGHTATHPVLLTCDDATARREIIDSKAELQAKTGCAVLHFSYPNGDYSTRDEEFVRRAGYHSARTVQRGLNDARTDPFRLKIVDILEDRSAADLELIELRLVWYGIRRLLGIGQ